MAQLTDNKLLKYEMISIPFTATNKATKIKFPDQQNLRNAKIQAIDFPQIAFDYYGKPCLNVNATYVVFMFFTFYIEGLERLHLMPALELKTINPSGGAAATQNSNNNGLLGINGSVITWTKSYISLPAALPPGADSVVVLGVWYY